MSFLSNLFHPANNTVPTGYPPIQSAPPGMPLQAAGTSAATTGMPAQTAVDPTTGLPLQSPVDPTTGLPLLPGTPGYGTDTYAPVFNVPTHTPDFIPGTVVGFLSYNHLQPQVSVRNVRVPKTVTETEQVPVRTRAPRVRPAADPVQAPAVDQTASMSRSARSASAARRAASAEATAAEAHTPVRGPNGRFLPRSAEAPAATTGVKVTAEGGKVTIQVENSAASTKAAGASAARASASHAAPAAMRGPDGRFLPRDAQPASDVSAASQDAPAAMDTSSAAGTDVPSEEPAYRTVTRTKQVMVSKTKVNASPVLPTNELMSVVKNSMLWSGGISLACNLYSLAKGQESVADAGSNVVGDVTSGAVSGLGGAVVSSLGTAALASAFGLAGGPLTLISFALGLGGYWAIDKLLRHTSMFKSLTSDVHQMLGGGPTYFPPQPAYPGYGTVPYGSAPYGTTVPSTMNPASPIPLGSLATPTTTP